MQVEVSVTELDALTVAGGVQSDAEPGSACYAAKLALAKIVSQCRSMPAVHSLWMHQKCMHPSCRRQKHAVCTTSEFYAVNHSLIALERNRT